MKIVRTAVAGSLESGDALIRVEAGNGTLEIEVESIVKARFGRQIERAVRETLTELGVSDAFVQVQDKGAVECALKARAEAAALRAGEAKS